MIDFLQILGVALAALLIGLYAGVIILIYALTFFTSFGNDSEGDEYNDIIYYDYEHNESTDITDCP